jgi:predicted phage terminase large subunit-like protein
VTSTTKTELQALLKNDLAAFTQRCFQTVVPGQTYLHNWHVEAIAHRLEKILRGETRRQIITLPPRNLKSICASVAFPAFVLGHDPSRRIVCVSYSKELAARHSRDCRAVLESDWYRGLFPRTRIDPRKNTETEYDTTARGFRLSTSVGGTLTGRGGNLIVIDDPMNPVEAASETKRKFVAEWFDTTLASRLDSKTEDAIVLVMQRLHVEDLVGHVLEKDPSWDVLNLPAVATEPQEIELGLGGVHRREIGDLLHPEREPMSVLEALLVDLGSQGFSAQYQQEPIPAGGSMIKNDWLRYYDRPPQKQSGDRIVQSWDSAAKADNKNDYSVCTTWLMRKPDFYLLDVFRKRLEYPDLRRAAVSRHAKFKARTVLIEDASTGSPLIQDLRTDSRIRPIAIRPERDKVVRLEGQSAVIEAGRMLLPRSAPWLDEFRNELLAFPHGRFDDQVDSVSQFLQWATERKPMVHVGGEF